MKPTLMLPAFAVVLAACGGSDRKKSFNYCDEMEKTNKEISEAEQRGRDLKTRMDAVPEGTDSTESQRFAYAQAIEKNREKIDYLKTYNQTNAENCSPSMKDPSVPDPGNYYR